MKKLIALCGVFLMLAVSTSIYAHQRDYGVDGLSVKQKVEDAHQMSVFLNDSVSPVVPTMTLSGTIYIQDEFLGNPLRKVEPKANAPPSCNQGDRNS